MNTREMIFDIRGPTISSKEVERAEAALGLHFPEDYSEFLVLCNGGKSKLCVCENPFVRIRYWFSVVESTEENTRLKSILIINERLRDEIDLGSDFLAIGFDVSDYPLVMKCNGVDKFRLGVWAWDINPPSQIKLPFQSFTDLVQHLNHSDDFV